MSRVDELERRARELAGLRDFGAESLRINEELTRLTPGSPAPRTRLGCCHEAAGDLLAALQQYELALDLAPENSVAKGLLARLRLRLHFPGVPMPAKLTGPAPTAFRGFPLIDFAELASVNTTDQALERFGPRFDDLGRQLNGLSTVASIQEIRAGSGGLFRAGTLWHQTGHLYTYHWGGRWELQCNVGLYSANSAVGRNLVRVGAGFNLTAAGRDPNTAQNRPKALRRFAALQQALAGTLGGTARRCLEQPGWALQFDGAKPALETPPEDAVARIRAANGEAVGWFFIGRWLSPNLSDDAKVLDDRRAFLSMADDVFRRLLPLFRAAA